MNQAQPRCVYCERDSNHVPLIPLVYADSQVWICPEHLPILIHKPAQLAGKLPGVENLGGREGHGQ